MLVASTILAILFMIGGLLMGAAAVMGWSWVIDSAPALTGRLSRTVVRVIYGILSLAVMAMAFDIYKSAL